MSEVTNTPVSETNVLEIRGNKRFLLNEFGEGQFKGIKFAYPEFVLVKNEAGEVDLAATGAQVFKSLGVDSGGDVIGLEMLNQAIKGRCATKVKNSLIRKNGAGDIDDNLTANAIQQALTKAGPSAIVFTVDEAAAWNPGEREVSAESAAKKLMKQFSSGNVSKEELLAKFMALANKQAAKLGK